MKTAVIFWSQSGNTEAMAKAVAEGANADLFNVNETTVENIESYDAVALGCPAMGMEELETDEFEPFYEDLIPSLKNKKVAIFGSYDWGDGEWIRKWKEDLESYGVSLVADGLMCNNEPDEDGLDECKKLGGLLI